LEERPGQLHQSDDIVCIRQRLIIPLSLATFSASMAILLIYLGWFTLQDHALLCALRTGSTVFAVALAAFAILIPVTRIEMDKRRIRQRACRLLGLLERTILEFDFDDVDNVEVSLKPFYFTAKEIRLTINSGEEGIEIGSEFSLHDRRRIANGLVWMSSSHGFEVRDEVGLLMGRADD